MSKKALFIIFGAILILINLHAIWIRLFNKQQRAQLRKTRARRVAIDLGTFCVVGIMLSVFGGSLETLLIASGVSAIVSVMLSGREYGQMILDGWDRLKQWILSKLKFWEHQEGEAEPCPN